MKLNKIYILAITCSLTFAGCSFLEEKSWDEVIPKTVADFAELLAGSGYPSPLIEPTSFVSLMDDDITFIGYQTQNGINQSVAGAPIYTWQPYDGRDDGSSPFATAYYAIYETIMGCNAVLDLIDDAVGTTEERDRVKAEALALRAYYYFKLVNLYGEPYNHNSNALGVPIKLESKIVNEYSSRSTVKEVYQRILTDLTEAVRLMEPLSVTRKNYRFNLPAINILLSRVYLHMGGDDELKKCVEQATAAYKTGSVLFDMIPLASQTAYLGSYYLNYDTNPEIEWIFGGMPHALNSAIWSPTREMLNDLFDSNDVRLVRGFDLPTWNTTVIVQKFGANRVGTTMPVQSFRTAEACLNRAEANAILGNLDDALEDYNELRRHRIIGYTDEQITDQDELIGAIREERRREFLYEGFRWFDLRRYGMPSITHMYAQEVGQQIHFVLEEEDLMYTLPLPNSLLLKNPELEQNSSGLMPDRLPVD